jgi:hypothetical protein
VPVVPPSPNDARRAGRDPSGLSRDGPPDLDPALASSAPLHLLAVFERPVDPLVALVGVDEGGPRDLVLWQVDVERRRASPVHRVRSGPDGSFAVERMLLSQRGVRLVAAPLGADPFGPDASNPIDFMPRAPSPAQEKPWALE